MGGSLRRPPRFRRPCSSATSAPPAGHGGGAPGRLCRVQGRARRRAAPVDPVRHEVDDPGGRMPADRHPADQPRLGMTVRALGTAPEWSNFLDVSNSALEEAMSALQRDAIDAAAEYARFARRVKDAPNGELQDMCRRVSAAMS